MSGLPGLRCSSAAQRAPGFLTLRYAPGFAISALPRCVQAPSSFELGFASIFNPPRPGRLRSKGRFPILILLAAPRPARRSPCGGLVRAPVLCRSPPRGPQGPSPTACGAVAPRGAPLRAAARKKLRRTRPTQVPPATPAVPTTQEPRRRRPGSCESQAAKPLPSIEPKPVAQTRPAPNLVPPNPARFGG